MMAAWKMSLIVGPNDCERHQRRRATFDAGRVRTPEPQACHTKSDYQAVFDYLKPIADTPLIRFDKPLVVRIRDKAAQDKGRKFANDVKARFSGIFGWGSERGYLATNPASGIKDIRRRKDAPDANRPWADEERDAVLGACPAHIRPAIALMMFTGLGT
jgi:hypothetical protein